MSLEDQILVGCNADEKDAHIFKCHEMIRNLKKAYFLVHNSASGLTEEDLERAERIYNEVLGLDESF